MSALLVAFESKYGQSQKIAERLAQVASERGCRVDCLHVDEAIARDLAPYGGVTAVAPVYFGRHPAKMIEFLERCVPGADRRLLAIVSVSNAAASPDPAEVKQAMQLARELVATTHTRPVVLATAAGALAYPRYPFFLRPILRELARRNGQPTDAAKNHELTDWAALESTFNRFLVLLEAATLGTPEARKDAGSSSMVRQVRGSKLQVG